MTQVCPSLSRCSPLGQVQLNRGESGPRAGEGRHRKEQRPPGPSQWLGPGDGAQVRGVWGGHWRSQWCFGGVLGILGCFGDFTCRLPPRVQNHNSLGAEKLLGHHLGGGGAPLEPSGHQGPPVGVGPEGPVLGGGTRGESEGT